MTQDEGNMGIKSVYIIIRAKWFVLLAQYCAGDKIEKNGMGWACGVYGRGEEGL